MLQLVERNPTEETPLLGRRRMQAHSTLSEADNTALPQLRRESLPLRLPNSADHIIEIQDRGTEGGSSPKIQILLIASVVIEIVSAAFEQLASAKKPGYALAALVLAVVGLLGCMTGLAYKAGKEKAEWRWDMAILWFYCPTDSPTGYRRFGILAEICGLACAILQSITSILAYVFYSQQSNNPIKLSFWPILFAIVLLRPQFLKD